MQDQQVGVGLWSSTREEHWSITVGGQCQGVVLKAMALPEVEVMSVKEGSREQFSCPEIFRWMEASKAKPQLQSWTRVEKCVQCAKSMCV